MKVKRSAIEHALMLTGYDGDVDQISKKDLVAVLHHEIMHLKAENDSYADHMVQLMQVILESPEAKALLSAKTFGVDVTEKS